MKKIWLMVISITLITLVGCQITPGDSSSTISEPSNIDPIHIDWEGNQQYPNHGTLKNGNKFDFYLLNDTHGSAEYLPSYSEPGISRISTYINEKRKENEDGTILISSGDMFQGSLDSNIGKGELMIEWMKSLKFDSMTIGNHEFDWGIETLKSNAQKLGSTESGKWGVPLLATNIMNNNTKEYDLGLPYVTFMKNGAKIAIIGSIGESAETAIDAKVLDGYDIESPTNIVRQYAQALRAGGADLIIYSTHGPVRSVSRSLADYVDVVFCGHSHYDEIETIRHDKYAIPAIQSLNNGQVVGHIQLTYNDGKFATTQQENSQKLTELGLEEDLETNNIYNSFLEKTYNDGVITDTLYNLKTKSIGKIKSLKESKSLSKNEVCSIFTKAQYSEYETSDNIYGSYYNGARSGWIVGEITYQDIYKAFPFDNTTLIIEATGEQLYKWSSITNTIKKEYESSTLYNVVACTYIINNFNIEYNKIVRTYDGIYQRQVMYNAFQHASDKTIITTF